MNELPPDLPRLKAIETYLQLQLRRVQQKVAEAEQWEASRRAAAQPRTPPEWTLQMDIGADPRPVAVHHGECTTGGKRLQRVTRRDAIEALSVGILPCALCRPDRELQVD
ncbi:DUF6233 domain-containing protein [Streptomyces sp. NPDC050355]|uniref:DUF6233 domain-containing protein n=1 Tax=Streptomyces sp. NPDC050355 TaxID=3365609 RepID=UPI0037A1CD73